jgi:hypothetical protein
MGDYPSTFGPHKAHEVLEMANYIDHGRYHGDQLVDSDPLYQGILPFFHLVLDHASFDAAVVFCI